MPPEALAGIPQLQAAPRPEPLQLLQAGPQPQLWPQLMPHPHPQLPNSPQSPAGRQTFATQPNVLPMPPGAAVGVPADPWLPAAAADAGGAVTGQPSGGVEVASFEAAVAAPAPAPAQKQAADGDNAAIPSGTTWGAVKQRFSSWMAESKANTYPNVTVNGVFQADAGFFSQDAASEAAHGKIQDGADFRRARLSAKGSVTETVNYFFQMDFAFLGRPTFTDVWLEQTQLPVLGNFRIGQWKQPFSLEVVSSFRYTTFMERSLLFQPFTPFRHLGAGFYDHSEDLDWTWAASGFRSGQDQFGDSISTDGGWGTAERITHLLYYDEPSDGRYYLHTGLGHFYSNPPNDTVNFRTIPEFFVGENAPGDVGTSRQGVPGRLDGTPFFVATGPLQVNGFNVLGTELLWVNGAFSLQSEAMVNFVDQAAGGKLVFPGFYAQVGYFLTGEHRPYDRVQGAIDRVKPFTNFFLVRSQPGVCNGWGAWELAARISYIDLDDKNVRGGDLADFTAGLNWFWNPYTKLVFNYIHAFNSLPPVGRNDTDIFGLRAQIDF